MSLWVTKLLPRLGLWLVRKIRQVQHNMSHCGVLSWRGIQARSWTCNFVSFWIQFNSRTQVSQRQNSVVMPAYHARFLNLSIVDLDPIDRAAKVQNNVCRMVGKIQWSLSAEPPSIWSPGITRPVTGRPIVCFPSLAISFFIWCF